MEDVLLFDTSDPLAVYQITYGFGISRSQPRVSAYLYIRTIGPTSGLMGTHSGFYYYAAGRRCCMKQCHLRLSLSAEAALHLL